jgi:hypothetical protein
VASGRFDQLDESEREWLRSSRRARSRRAWLTATVAAVVVAALVWLIVHGVQSPPGKTIPPPATAVSADSRVVSDTRTALKDWGMFGATGDLRVVQSSFWQDGPQYKELQKEAPGLLKRHVGLPAYTFTLETPFKIINAGSDKIIRGTVATSRPGEPTHRYQWDIYMRQDPKLGGRWRVWTVAETPK